MMKPFLKRVAEEIASRFGDDPGSVCVVLPNRRAGLYLRKYLAGELSKTAWAPQMWSIEDFITGISGFRVIDPAGLLFELYAIHRELEGDKAQDFELFSDWGQVLLRDFEEIDQYLADPDKIFTFLDEARALSVWNLGERPLTEHEKEYIRFYQSFRIYYSRLRERLLDKKEVYQGLAYRFAAENIAEWSQRLSCKKVIFAGLNAMAAAEEKILDHLLKSGKAEIFWDADEYYLRDESQEAGNFIREHLKRWPSDPVKWLEKELLGSRKEIRVFGIPRGTGQALKASQIIRETGKAKEGAPDNTALVLADESLLLPVLYSLPEETGPVNVTMGFPFKYTNLYQLIYLLFQMQENAERFSRKDESKPAKFYAKDVLKVLSHPYLFLWTGSGVKNDPDVLADSIRYKNRVFLNAGEILALAPEMSDEFRKFLESALERWISPEKAMKGLLDIMESLKIQLNVRHDSEAADHELDQEYLYHLSKILRRCSGLMEDYPFVQSLKSLRKIIFQVLDMSRLPFYGEPLKGLQVMGILETRAIDFENLIVLSVNEGTLPSGRTTNSFIPFDIKLAFGLPTFQQKDAVFAYHFYRMIQRASNIFLLYDTEGDLMKGGEKSRFITQILHELKKRNPNIHIEEDLLSPSPPRKGVSAVITMPKTPAVLKALSAKATKGFSPSSLNLFIRCPLQFYFQEVLGITESEEIEETIEAKTMGTAIHDVLFRIYQPFIGRSVEPDALKERLREAETLLKEAFGEHYKEGDLEHGKNHLIFKVSQYLVNQLVRSEAEKLEEEEDPGHTLSILHLEKFLETTIECQSGSGTVIARIKGKTDRIDQWGGTVRVIDYKTGAVRQEELRVKSWDALRQDPKMAKAFQLLVYAFLYYRNFPDEATALVTGNITLRKISEDVMRVRLPEEQAINEESMDIFYGILVDVVEKILDPEIPFDQTEEIEYCTNCPFRSICNR